jgi:hypothetical protein
VRFALACRTEPFALLYAKRELSQTFSRAADLVTLERFIWAHGDTPNGSI